MQFCGEIQYQSFKMGEDDDPYPWNIHSDICQHADGPVLPEMREFLHKCLDEWLDNSDGTGYFWLGNHDEIVGKEDEDND